MNLIDALQGFYKVCEVYQGPLTVNLMENEALISKIGQFGDLSQDGLSLELEGTFNACRWDMVKVYTSLAVLGLSVGIVAGKVWNSCSLKKEAQD